MFNVIVINRRYGHRIGGLSLWGSAGFVAIATQIVGRGLYKCAGTDACVCEASNKKTSTVTQDVWFVICRGA